MPLIIVLLLAVVVIYLLRRGGQPSPNNPVEQEARLLHLCLGDRQQAERLIAAEMRRAPGLSRTQAIDRAYGQLCRAKR